ncbi:MAG: hypothetical protein KC635_25215 [Myxococcales bacterium]|nr:hypothetical protein [Myxococcales bacterium]MCB9731830.1 hypothetical protein [Deltaproteobacteria bacterium]
MRLSLRHLTAASAFAALLATVGVAHAGDVTATVKEDTSGAAPKGLDLKLVTGNDLAVKVERVIRWTDAAGDNVAVFATTGKEGVKDGERYESKSLHVGTFLDKGGKLTRVQKIIESVQPCPLDLYAAFIPGASGVGDADGDGVGELTIAYQTACVGDISPRSMKVLVLQKDKKWALRGEAAVDIGDGEIIGGDFKADFRKAPPALLEHAKRVWAKHKRQTY